MTSLQFARKIAALLDAKQASDVVILDLRKVPQIAEFFVVATGMVDLHVRTLADYVEEGLRKSRAPRKPLSREGERNLAWVVLDYGNVVVHIYRPETRKYYQLDNLWADVPRIPLTAPPRTSRKNTNDAG